MTFTASNGIPVIPDGDYYHFTRAYRMGTLTGIPRDSALALREFFQHERDEELGRWRWPDNPDVVVYPGDDSEAVVVLDEKAARSWWVEREDLDYWNPEEVAAQAATAYFEAHPAAEPPTWVNAHVITWRDGAYLPQIAQRDQHGDLGWYTWLGHDGRWFNVDGLAQLIGDADVTVLVPEPVS